ncbi:hypothetical protein EON77_21825, partial [bacterium]
DLRTRDHVAWAAATSEAQEIAVVFVFDTNILDALPDRDDRRLTFLRASLDEVDGVLGAHGSALLTRHGDPVEIIPRLAQELGVEAVFTNGDIDPYAIERDAKIARTLKADGRALRTYKDHVVFAPDEIISPQGQPYRQHRPYAARWIDRLDPERDLAVHDPDLARMMPREALAPHLQSHQLEEIGFVPVPLWLEPGETAAHDRLERFLDEQVRGYAEDRNLPAVKGVSGLSVHLRHGTLYGGVQLLRHRVLAVKVARLVCNGGHRHQRTAQQLHRLVHGQTAVLCVVHVLRCLRQHFSGLQRGGGHVFQRRTRLHGCGGAHAIRLDGIRNLHVTG